MTLDPAIEGQLLGASRSTIERLLASRRPPRRPHGQSPTKPGTLRQSVPVRTWTEWHDAVPGDVVPGDVGIDLLGHGGDSTEGFFLCMLTMTDVVSGWTELEPVWGKGKSWSGARCIGHGYRCRRP